MLTEAQMCLRVDVQRAVRSLPTAERRVIHLMLVEGFSARETAAALDLPVGSVLRLCRRGGRRLQRQLRVYAPNNGLYAKK